MHTETIHGLNLRPCPFCGGKAEARVDWLSRAANAEPKCFVVSCTTCSASFPWQSGNVERWNSRIETDK